MKYFSLVFFLRFFLFIDCVYIYFSGSVVAEIRTDLNT